MEVALVSDIPADAFTLVDTFSLINDFLEDLLLAFKEKHSGSVPLIMFHRVVSLAMEDRKNPAGGPKVTKANATAELTVLQFKEFLREHRALVFQWQMEKMPTGTTITFRGSTAIYIDIREFYVRSDSSSKEVIRNHLLSISESIFGPDEESSVPRPAWLIEGEGEEEEEYENVDQLLDAFLASCEDLIGSRYQEGGDPMAAFTHVLALFQTPRIHKMLGSFVKMMQRGDITVANLIPILIKVAARFGR